MKYNKLSRAEIFCYKQFEKINQKLQFYNPVHNLVIQKPPIKVYKKGKKDCIEKNNAKNGLAWIF